MSLSDSSFIYCQGCGESVQTHAVVVEGALQKRCVFCGLVLDTRNTSVETSERALVVDDSEMLCDLLSDVIVDSGLAGHVKTCQNGREFVVEFTQALISHQPPGFIILDIEMPILDGIHTCIVARAIERGFGVAPTPIIFFSVRKADENMRKVLKACSPAAYLNKASAPRADMIGDRLSAIIRQVTVKGE